MLKKVILLTDTHTHDGKPCKSGDTLNLDEQQAEFLIQQNAAELAEQPSKKE